MEKGESISLILEGSMKIGIIGTGAIAPVYMAGMGQFPDDVEIVACADIQEERAKAFAEAHSLEARSIDALLASDDIELIVNLTIPAAHYELNTRILKAGKHLYSEKPLGLSFEEAEKSLALAAEKGLRVGCAPDTMMGEGIQTARRLIDEGAIGRPLSASAFMMYHGPDSWHPNPFFYFAPGGGPMLDMGPYYLGALVYLMGSIASVTGMVNKAFDERIAGHEAIRGQRIPVTVNTHVTGLAQFEQGAIATLIMSFDTWKSYLPRLEIHGTEGSLSLPNPNVFEGTVQLWKPDTKEWRDVESRHRGDFQRGVGVADMAQAIQANRPHQASGELALHLLEAMLAFEQSAQEKQHILIKTRITQPEALAPNL
jgi:predicted dehydrogenase